MHTRKAGIRAKANKSNPLMILTNANGTVVAPTPRAGPMIEAGTGSVKDPMPTDDIWQEIDERFVGSTYVEGTHPQASWIYINTHPVYMYGYLWSRVYAQDMFTQFEADGLRDTTAGTRYRELILSNGRQRAIEEVVEEFLGRPMNNEAYIRSLGLEGG